MVELILAWREPIVDRHGVKHIQQTCDQHLCSTRETKRQALLSVDMFSSESVKKETLGNEKRKPLILATFWS
jgi:hypothetical protein